MKKLVKKQSQRKPLSVIREGLGSDVMKEEQNIFSSQVPTDMYQSKAVTCKSIISYFNNFLWAS